MTDSKPKGYLAKYGARLISQGYEIVPIRRGSKAPPYDEWSKVDVDTKSLRAMLDGSFKCLVSGEKRSYDGSRDGVGIKTRKTPLVDIDVLDATLAQAMQDFVELEFGVSPPVRIGLAPKRGLLFRAEKPFAKVLSASWVDPLSDAVDAKGRPYGHKVEILGAGQQFVAYARHPDTGQPYEWIGDGPSQIKAADLPILTEAQAKTICLEFDRLAAEAGWERRRSTSTALTRSANVEYDLDDPFAEDAQLVEIEEDELVRKLMLVPGCDEYDLWTQIGMALYHQYEGGPRGLELWHEWSRPAHNYDSDALDDKWPSFEINGKGRAPLTARIILKLAKGAEAEQQKEELEDVKADLMMVQDLIGLKTVCERIRRLDFEPMVRNQLVGIVQARYKALTNTAMPIGMARDYTRHVPSQKRAMPKWVEGWVFCEADETFYHMVQRASLSITSFNAKNARHLLTAEEKLEGMSAPEQSPHQVALNLYEIPVVFDRRYMPGEDELFWLNGTRYVNSYDGRNVPEVPEKLTRAEKADVQRVMAHFEHLFEHEQDRNVLIDSIAYLVQNPGKRLNWATLIQGTEGDGKTFFYELFCAMLAMENVGIIGAQTVEEKYTSWAEGSQIVFAEEIRLQGHNRYDILNRVKPLISNRVVPVRRMQTDVYSVINMTSYFLATNYKDALPLTANDTRYFVLFSRWQTKEMIDAFNRANPTYYDELYLAIQNSAGALRKHFLEHEISKSFRPNKRAPQSVAKLEMIRTVKTEEQEAYEAVMRTSARMDLTRTLLNVTALADAMEQLDFEAPYGRAMAKLLLDNGFSRLGHVWFDGRKCLFFSQTPAMFLTDQQEVDEAAVRAYAEDAL